jgi:F420-dependent oxidoreductase-like protein
VENVFGWGLTLASVTDCAEPPGSLFPKVRDLAVAADTGAWDCLYVPDHVWQNRIGGGPLAPMFEAYTLLGALAAITQRVHLGAFVSPVTLRSPALLAKAVASLDVISGGRAVLGLGAGTDVAEHAAYGIAFGPIGERQQRLGEALEICRRMLAESEPSFPGRHYAIEGAFNVPRPLQHRVPVLVGGGGERGTLSLVARHADACNLPPASDEDLLRKLEVIDRHCADLGRDPAGIARTAFVVPPADVHDLIDRTGHLMELGMTGVVVAANHATVDTVYEWGEALHDAFGRSASPAMSGSA